MKKELLLALVLFSTSILLAHNDGETRTAEHTVAISSTDEISILSKNTYLEISTWNKNEVQVKATITFDGKMTDRVQKFLDEFESRVKNGIYKSGGELKIDAQMEEPNKVQVGSRHVGIIVSYDNKELRIRYEIKLPGKNTLMVKSAYEDLIMNGEYDEVEITQNSADLRAGTFKKAKLFLKYGDSKIERLDEGYIESYENDTQFGVVGYLDANDKYSEYKFHSLEKMDIQGYETDIKATKINSIDGNLKYGELKVGEYLGTGEFTLYEYEIGAGKAGTITSTNSKYSNYNFGSVDLVELTESYEDELEADFIKKLTTKSKYGDYNIGELGVSFSLSGYEDDISISSISDNAQFLKIDGKYLNLDLDLNGRAFTLDADVKYGNIDYDEDALEVNKYIKENDKLFIEAIAKTGSGPSVKITIKGYEIDANLD